MWVACRYFSEDERLFVVDRVDAVAGDHLRAELAAHRVRRKSKHVHLHVRSQLPVREKLAGDNLQSTNVLRSSTDHKINRQQQALLRNKRKSEVL